MIAEEKNWIKSRAAQPAETGKMFSAILRSWSAYIQYITLILFLRLLIPPRRDLTARKRGLRAATGLDVCRKANSIVTGHQGANADRGHVRMACCSYKQCYPSMWFKAMQSWWKTKDENGMLMLPLDQFVQLFIICVASAGRIADHSGKPFALCLSINQCQSL